MTDYTHHLKRAGVEGSGWFNRQEAIVGSGIMTMLIITLLWPAVVLLRFGTFAKLSL